MCFVMCPRPGAGSGRILSSCTGIGVSKQSILTRLQEQPVSTSGGTGKAFARDVPDAGPTVVDGAYEAVA